MAILNFPTTLDPDHACWLWEEKSDIDNDARHMSRIPLISNWLKLLWNYGHSGFVCGLSHVGRKEAQKSRQERRISKCRRVFQNVPCFNKKTLGVTRLFRNVECFDSVSKLANAGRKCFIDDVWVILACTFGARPTVRECVITGMQHSSAYHQFHQMFALNSLWFGLKARVS
jgi:hypothetical protein